MLGKTEQKAARGGEPPDWTAVAETAPPPHTALQILECAHGALKPSSPKATRACANPNK